ncbi:MAG: hypothetical protein KAV82_03450 [Phycisphaerae bacterium]|nr:hypothetical protein [Phycisphaerae bacterium]
MDLSLLATVLSLLGISARDFYRLYQERLKKEQQRFSEEQLAARRQAIGEITSRGLHTALLLKLYPDLQTAGLSRFAVGFDGGEDAATTIVGSPEQLGCAIELTEGSERHRLVEVDCKGPDLDQATATEILASTEARGLNLWDQGIYRLDAIEMEPHEVRASFSLDRFMRYRLGIGALLDELLQALIDTELCVDKVFEDRDQFLPLRSKFLPTAQSVSQFGQRMCAGGILATVAILRPDPYDDFVIPIQRRSWSTSDEQGMITVIPQAFHQPTIDPAQEMNLRDTFLRELYEELFGGEEAIRGTRRLRHDWYTMESPEVQWLQANQNHWRLVLTGFGLDLATGNYIFALLCVIRHTGFWDQFSHKIVGNWESTEADAPLVSTKKDTARLKKLLFAPACTRVSIFSLARGLEYLVNLEPAKVNLPGMNCRYS